MVVKSNRMKELISSFSCLTPRPNTSYGRSVYSDAWGSFVAEEVKVDVRCDLTFRKCIEITEKPMVGMPHINGKRIPPKTYKEYITEADAYSNIKTFCERLNYACYKHAYKRYGKRLNCIIVAEGGEHILRENAFTADASKRIHGHLLLQRPDHIDFLTFELMIITLWRQTKWGYLKENIEEIKTIKGSAGYNVKSTLDTIDLTNTYFDNSYRANDNIN